MTDQPPTPGDYAIPFRFIAGFEADDLEPEVIWQTPKPVTIEMRNVDIETMELAVGLPLIPLAERQIPERGTE